MSLPAIPVALRSVALPAINIGINNLLAYLPKEPDEIVDYGIDATALFRKSGDTFTSAVVSISPSDMSSTIPICDDTHITFRLSGGTKFLTYSVKISATLASGELVVWNGSLLCGSSSLFVPPTNPAQFEINGFGLANAGAALTVGGN